MKNIKINDENVEVYQEYLLVNQKMISDRKDNDPRMMKLMIIIVSLGVVAFFSALLFSNNGIAFWIVLLGTICFPFVYQEYDHKIRIKRFKKKYPDFDTTLDINELEKVLNKYYELSKLPKDLEKQEEEHLSFNKEVMGKMTNEERIAFLEKEKEFWMQIQKRDALLKEDQLEEEYQKRIEM